MSKMNTPEMDVVRFGESDVIVASGVRNNVMTLSGIGDNEKNNIYLTYNSTPYHVTDGLDLFALDFSYGSKSNITSEAPIYLFGDHDTTLSQLPSWDTDTGVVSVNGDYEWTGEHFSKRQ